MALTNPAISFGTRFGGLIALLAIGLGGCTAQVGDDDILAAAEGLRIDRACLSDRLRAADADPADRRRIVDARPDCFVDDPGDRPDRLAHCSDVRLLAERLVDNPRGLRRLANAYPECFGGGDDGDDTDRCSALRERASEARDPAEARAWLARYYACIDDRDPGPDIACTDGTRPLCDGLVPECGRGEVLAVIDSCWACVAPERCEPPVTDRCSDFRRLADAAFQAGDRARYRYYSDAYRRCTAVGGEPTDPGCDELRRSAEAARDAGDDDRFRYYTSRYLACIEGDRPGDTDCGELRQAAARADAAGLTELFRRYVTAYLECIDGREGPPELTCDNVLCTADSHCVETPRGPVCIPNECRAITDAAGRPIVSCPMDPPSGCPRDYAPVCGADGVTYTNSCLAREAGATPVTDGECTRR